MVDDVLVDGPRPLHPGWALDVHEDVAAAALRHQLEDLLPAAADVVDGAGAGGDAARATGAEWVSAETGSPVAARPSIAGTRAAISSSAAMRAAASGDGADVEHVEAGGGQRPAVLDGALRCEALRAPARKATGSSLFRTNYTKLWQLATG